MLENVLFEFYRGRTYTRDFTITGYTDTVTEMYFSLCENVNNKNTCIQKTLSDGQITVVDTGTDAEGNTYTTYNLLLEATDTDRLKTDMPYYFDIAIISGTKKVEVMAGTMVLKGAVTKTCNEC